MANIASAKKLIERTRSELAKLEVVGAQALGLPSLWIFIVVIAIIAIVIPIFLVARRKKLIPSLRPYIIPIGKVTEKVKKTEEPSTKEENVKEREKLMRMLDVLDRERNEGIISAVAYKEMKGSIESKLSKLEKKLK